MTGLWRRFRGLPAWLQAVAWIVLLLVGAPVWFAGPGADPAPTAMAALEPAEVPAPTPSSAPLPGQIPADAQAGVVEKVVDGDTIAVRIDEPGGPLAANASHTIRLLEIDTPETVHPSKPVECWGPEASRFTRGRLALGSTVYLVADAEDTDRYGRFLRYVWTADGTFFNAAAVREGHARAVLYEPNDAHIDTLRAAEAEARAARRGMWGAPCDAAAAGPGSAPSAPPAPASADPATPQATDGCEPGYDPCVPRSPADLDCAAVGGPVRVTGPDPHRLDGDGDGWGCEG